MDASQWVYQVFILSNMSSIIERYLITFLARVLNNIQVSLYIIIAFYYVMLNMLTCKTDRSLVLILHALKLLNFKLSNKEKNTM